MTPDLVAWRALCEFWGCRIEGLLCCDPIIVCAVGICVCVSILVGVVCWPGVLWGQ